MNNVETSSVAAQPVAARRSNPGRFLYAMFALTLVALMAWGFQHFYFHGRAYPGRPLTPPIRTLVILHGTAMAAWMLLFVAQPFLIATGNRRLHMNVGKIGAVIATAVVVLGLKLAIESTRVNPPEMKIWGLSPKQFMAVPVISIFIFGALVAAAVWNRRRPELHRALMLLATLSAMPAAVSRIDALSNLYHGTVWEKIFGPFLWTLAIALAFLIVKSVLKQKLNVTYALGCAGLIFTSAFVMWIAPTGAWDALATLLLR